MPQSKEGHESVPSSLPKTFEVPFLTPNPIPISAVHLSGEDNADQEDDEVSDRQLTIIPSPPHSPIKWTEISSHPQTDLERTLKRLLASFAENQKRLQSQLDILMARPSFATLDPSSAAELPKVSSEST